MIKKLMFVVIILFSFIFAKEPISNTEKSIENSQSKRQISTENQNPNISYIQKSMMQSETISNINERHVFTQPSNPVDVKTQIDEGKGVACTCCTILVVIYIVLLII